MDERRTVEGEAVGNDRGSSNGAPGTVEGEVVGKEMAKEAVLIPFRGFMSF